MKIIISHDVDHLFWSDHLRDLFYIKLWIRETLTLLRGKITASVWKERMLIPFHKRINHIDELLDYDDAHGVPSAFFFGMSNGLSLSYKKERALPYIRQVIARGHEAGVHGIAYDDSTRIEEEYNAYKALTGTAPSGIRMHYVRRSDHTLAHLCKAGYLYDSTVFDKKTGMCIKAPYQVGDMWEFPLSIMDVYLPNDLEQAKSKTMEAIESIAKANIDYCVILFHDTNFSAAYPVYRDWYQWLIDDCTKNEIQFTSFRRAIAELKTS